MLLFERNRLKKPGFSLRMQLSETVMHVVEGTT